MNPLKNIFFLILLNWVMAFIFFITGILVLIGNVTQSLTRSTAMPFGSFFIDILLVCLVSFVINERFTKIPRRHFFVAQALFALSFLTLVFLALSTLFGALLSNA
jgi:uncharacterized membrane protein